MAPRRRCPTCGSRQWHKEPSSGLIACSEGHILQSYRNEATEAENLGPHALKKRALKRNKQRKVNEGRANPRLYHGARSHYLYFQALQLLLRHQVSALKQLWSLPPEFELICRDTWALYLASLSDPPPPAPLPHHQNQGTDIQGDESFEALPPTPRSDVPLHAGDEASLSGSESDSELEALLRENSEIDTSSSEGEQETETPRTPKRRMTRRCVESPICTLAVLVIACWTLRIPIFYRDLVEEVEKYRVPYLEGLKLLPESMVSHFNKHTIQMFVPRFAPTITQLHERASRMAKVLFDVYGVLTPEANVAPILWRCVRSVGGTPVLYSLARELARILSLPVTLHHTLAPKIQRKRARDPERHTHDNTPPEVGLQCCVIVILKMMYGFDGQSRSSTKLSDPAHLLPRITEFLSMLSVNATRQGSEAAFHSRNTSMRIGDLSEDQLDTYLDFCEKALLSEKQTDQSMLDYFPFIQSDVIRDDAESQAREKPVAVIAGPAPLNTISPGAQYQMYHGRQIWDRFPKDYQLVLECAGRSIGVEVEYVSGMVEVHERRLMGWWQLEKRRRLQ